MKINIKKLTESAIVPEYKTEEAAGMDLFSDVECTVNPSEIKLVKTGIAIQLPIGYEAQVRPRSGLALKNGITVLNTPGTVDSDYRGEVGVILVNHGKEPFNVKKGDRVAQLVIASVIHASVLVVDELNETNRGAAGFGSTGV